MLSTSVERLKPKYDVESGRQPRSKSELLSNCKILSDFVFEKKKFEKVKKEAREVRIE